MRTITYVSLFALAFSTISAQKILWESSYGGKNAEFLFDVVPTADYGFILAGSTLSSKTGLVSHVNEGDLDYWIWKMDEHGKPEWNLSFGGDKMDLLKKVIRTHDGGLLLAGISSSGISGHKTEPNLGLEDVWLIKLDAAGKEEWQKTIGGKGHDYLSSIAVDGDGYILGITSSSDSYGSDKMKTQNSKGGLDYWVVRIDGKGKIKWERTFGGKYAEQLVQVIPNDKGYLVGGFSNSPLSGDKSTEPLGQNDLWILQLNKEGNLLNQITFGGTKDDQLNILQKTTDGGYILGGSSNSEKSNLKTASQQRGYDFWLIRLNEDLELVWEQTHSITEKDKLTSIVEEAEGGFLISGYGDGYSEAKKQDGLDDYIMLRLDAKGEEKWRRIVGSNGKDQMVKAVMTRDGGFLLCGYSDGKKSRDKKSISQGNDFWIVKIMDEQKEMVDKIPLEAFPNPTAAFTNIIIGFEFEKAELHVFDLNGRQVHHETVYQRTVPIQMSKFPDGIYIVEVRSGKDKGVAKIMKYSI
jgi:hypothetical protein